MKRFENIRRFMLLAILGLAAVLALLIPHLAAHQVCFFIVTGIVTMLIVLVTLSYPLALSLLFMGAMAVFGWGMELEEGAMLWFDLAAGVLFVWILGSAMPNLYWRIALGCVAGSLTLALGTSWLLILRKQTTLPETLAYALSLHWKMLLSSLVGGMLGALIWQNRFAASRG